MAATDVSETLVMALRTAPKGFDDDLDSQARTRSIVSSIRDRDTIFPAS
jgi:hypothetical protein